MLFKCLVYWSGGDRRVNWRLLPPPPTPSEGSSGDEVLAVWTRRPAFHSQNLLQIKQWHYRSWDDFWNQEATISIFPPVLLLLMLKHQILCPLSSPSPCTQSASLKLSSQNLSSHSLKSLSRASKMTCKWKKTSKSLWERVMQPQGLESSGVEGSVC